MEARAALTGAKFSPLQNIAHAGQGANPGASGGTAMDWKCHLKEGLEFLMPLFAVAAAIFWFASAGIGFRLFERYLKWQASSFNAVAALCAGIAALIQLAITYFLPLCRAFA
jgi:hypothetical protein